MKKKYLIILLLIITNGVYGQNDTITKKNRDIYDFSRNDLLHYGYDSLERKQGEWTETIETFVMYYNSNSIFIIEEVTAIGYYSNGLKEGIWNIWSLKDGKLNKLECQSYYINNNLIYSIYFKDLKIKSIVRFKKVFRYNSHFGNCESDVVNDITIFDKNGKMISREFYSPEGIFERQKY